MSGMNRTDMQYTGDDPWKAYPAILWFDGEWVPGLTHEMGPDIYNVGRNLKPGILSELSIRTSGRTIPVQPAG